MANNCHCTLKLSGPADELQRFENQAKATDADYALSLESLHPTPKEMSTEERRDWHQNNWGSTGDAYRVHQAKEEDGSLSYEFATAWSPPNQAFIKHLAEMFPNLEITLDFEEPMMEYEGRITAANRELTSATNGRFDFYERYTTSKA